MGDLLNNEFVQVVAAISGGLVAVHLIAKGFGRLLRDAREQGRREGRRD